MSILSPPSISQLLYSVRPPLMLYWVLPLMPTVPSSWPVWLTTPGERVTSWVKVAAVEFEFLNLLAGDGVADFGGLRVHLGDVFTGDDDFFGDGADREGDVHAGFLGYFKDNVLGFKFLKAFGSDNDCIFPGRKGGAT